MKTFAIIVGSLFVLYFGYVVSIAASPHRSWGVKFASSPMDGLRKHNPGVCTTDRDRCETVMKEIAANARSAVAWIDANPAPACLQIPVTDLRSSLETMRLVSARDVYNGTAIRSLQAVKTSVDGISSAFDKC